MLWPGLLLSSLEDPPKEIQRNSGVCPLSVNAGRLRPSWCGVQRGGLCVHQKRGLQGGKHEGCCGEPTSLNFLLSPPSVTVYSDYPACICSCFRFQVRSDGASCVCMCIHACMWTIFPHQTGDPRGHVLVFLGSPLPVPIHWHCTWCKRCTDLTVKKKLRQWPFFPHRDLQHCPFLNPSRGAPRLFVINSRNRTQVQKAQVLESSC